MNENLTKLFWFVFGAGVGVGIGWYVFKKRQEEACWSDDLDPDDFGRDEDGDESVIFGKRYFTSTTPDSGILTVKPYKTEEDVVEINEEKNDDFVKTVYEEALRYFKDKDLNEEYERVEKPYIISPNEFGELYDYSKSSLFYFSDGIVTDDDYYVVDEDYRKDVIDNLGIPDMFNDDVDAVYVRYDRKQQDIEVLYDIRPYSEILEERPYLME